MQRLEPVQGILTILDEAKMTGPNKLGLLLVILELAPLALRTDSSKETHLMSIDDIVDKTLELHWKHTEEFPFFDGYRKIRFMAGIGNQISAVTQVEKLQSHIDKRLGYEIAKRRIEENEWKKAHSELKNNLLRNPIDRLQNLPGYPSNFLFELTPDSEFLEFFPGVIDELVKWGNVLRPVIELHYLNFIQSVNRTESHQEDLYKFLFGEERSMPGLSVRQELWEIQAHKCIYTDDELAKPTASHLQSLDHVVPWSRMRLSVIENFVLTNDRRNNDKRALLLDLSTLAKWRKHMQGKSTELRDLARDNSWPSDMNRVLQGLSALYSTPTPPLVWGPSGVTQMTEDDRDGALDLLKTG